MNTPSTERYVRWVSALAAGCVAIAGCGGSSGADGSGAASDLAVTINSGVSTVDPAFACNTQYDYWIVKNTYDTLVQYSSDGRAGAPRKIVPGLATRWTISPDGRTYTFRLRDDVRFSSGNRMTADDVVYGLRRVREKQGCQDYVLTLGDPKSIRSIEKVSKDVVRIRLSRPNPIFLGQLTQTGLSPVDHEELEAHGGLGKRGDQWLATHSAGTGAYTLAEYQPDSQVTLKAREEYWQGKPRNTGVSIRVVTDASTYGALVQSGQVDLAYGLPLKDLETQAQGKRLINDPGPFFIYLGLNTKKAPFDDVRVRKAVELAIDRAGIAKRLGYGKVQTFDGPMPPAMPFSSDLPVPDQDVAKAKALVQQAGAAGQTITVEVKSGEDVQREMATILQASLADIGLKLKISTTGASTFFDRVSGLKAQAYLIRDGSPFNDPAYFLGFFVKCGNAFNWTQYCDRRVDQLLAQGKVEEDAGRREAIYGELSRIVADAVPVIPMFALGTGLVAKDDVNGYVAYDDQQPLFWSMSTGGS